MIIDIASDNEFGNEEAFLDFLGVHEITHQQINNFMQMRGLAPISLPLTSNPENTEYWLMDHYLMHQNEFALLGISSDYLPDLSVVDFKNQEQYDDWMQNHAAVHDILNSTLGILE